MPASRQRPISAAKASLDSERPAFVEGDEPCRPDRCEEALGLVGLAIFGTARAAFVDLDDVERAEAEVLPPRPSSRSA